MKVRLNWHRHDYSEPDADTKPVQTGTPVFIRELKSRHFPKADEVVKHVRGQQLTLQHLQTNGFESPIIIDGKDGLDMTVPPPNFSVYDIESCIGINSSCNISINIILFFLQNKNFRIQNKNIEWNFFSFQVEIETWM